MTTATLEKAKELSLVNPDLFQEIMRNCWNEVAKRVREHPEKIEDVQLFRLFSELTKTALVLSKNDKPVSRERVRDLEGIMAGLPFDRQIELLKEAINRIDEAGGDSSAQRATLEQLLGKTGAEKALAIEGETDG